MHEVSVRTLVPVALSTATATFIGQRLFGDAPAFTVPPVHASMTVGVLPAYVVLGAGMAWVAVAFIRALYGAEDLFEKWIGGDYARHIVGTLGVGLTIEAAMVFWGHYYVEGVGYATIGDVLKGALPSVWMLVALGGLKLLTTSLTLGSGGRAGIFLLRCSWARRLEGRSADVCTALPGLPFDPAALALAGMAGLVAGATGAALTAIVMTFEMTLDYSVVLPMTLTVAVSHGLRRLLLQQNIYTMKLARRGHVMPEALQANAYLVHHVADMAMATAAALPPTAAAELRIIDNQAEGPVYWVIVDGENIVGVISRQWVREHPDALLAATSLADVVRHDFVEVGSGTTLFDLIAAMQRVQADLAVVVTTEGERMDGAPRFRGVVTKTHIVEAIADGMRFSKTEPRRRDRSQIGRAVTRPADLKSIS